MLFVPLFYPIRFLNISFLRFSCPCMPSCSIWVPLLYWVVHAFLCLVWFLSLSSLWWFLSMGGHSSTPWPVWFLPVSFWMIFVTLFCTKFLSLSFLRWFLFLSALLGWGPYPSLCGSWSSVLCLVPAPVLLNPNLHCDSHGPLLFKAQFLQKSWSVINLQEILNPQSLSLVSFLLEVSC